MRRVVLCGAFAKRDEEYAAELTRGLLEVAEGREGASDAHGWTGELQVAVGGTKATGRNRIVQPGHNSLLYDVERTMRLLHPAAHDPWADGEGRGLIISRGPHKADRCEARLWPPPDTSVRPPPDTLW